MTVDARDVAKLRERTGVGMMDCKRALEETGGDAVAAIELLRKRLKGKMEERTDRVACEGVISVASESAGASMVELRSETDFAARSAAFSEGANEIARYALRGDVPQSKSILEVIERLQITIKENISLARIVKFEGTVGTYVHHNGQIGVLVQVQGEMKSDLLRGICHHVAAHVPIASAVNEQGLPPGTLGRVRQEALQDVPNREQRADIIEKIVEGKVRKWMDEHTLLGQRFLGAPDAKAPVREFMPATARIIRFARFAVGEIVTEGT